MIPFSYVDGYFQRWRLEKTTSTNFGAGIDSQDVGNLEVGGAFGATVLDERRHGDFLSERIAEAP